MTYTDRNNIPEEYKWDLTRIYKTQELWEKDLAKISGEVKKVEAFKGKIGESKENFKDLLLMNTELSMLLEKVFMHSKLALDLNNGDSAKQAMNEKALSVLFDLQERLSFVLPEMSAIDPETLKNWVNSTPELKEYKHSVDKIIRQRRHVLSEKEEKLLAMVSPAIDSISSAFSMFNNVDIDLGEVTDEKGNKIPLTHGLFGKFRDSKNREVRAGAFKTMHTSFEKMGNTVSTLYSGSVRSDVFYSKARGFEDSLENALFSDNLPRSIYTNLIESVREALPSNFKYLEIRRKMMKLDKLHIYDTYIPIIELDNKEYSYDEACDMVISEMKPLGDEYVKDLKELLSGGWVDVYETPGKATGAYATSVYDVHPFMLLNYSGQLDDVFTLAHEAGHCMHSFYSNKQHYENNDYPIFLAEIASTVNENILVRGLLEKCDSSTKEGKFEKAYLINRFLEGFKGTVFRQTMFAEFELKSHELAEQGAPLTAEVFCDVYEDLLKDYFGDDVVIDDYMRWEWARIPHFYRAFYVYKYATGFSAATAITNKILNDNTSDSVEKYLEFLHAGGSDYPSETLKKAGVDLTNPEPVRNALKEFSDMVSELEKLVDELK